jgi:phage-related protein
VKRSLQPLRHANRQAQAGAVVRDFTSVHIKRSPFSFGDAFKKVTSTVSKGVDVVKSGVSKGKDLVKSGISKGKDLVKSAPKKALDLVKAAPKKIAQALTDAPKKLKQVASKAKQGAQKVVDKAKSLGKSIAKGGKQLDQKVEHKAVALASGAKSGFDKAVNATGGLVNDAGKEIGKIVDSGTGAVDGFVNAVGIHRASPSIDTEHKP